MTNKELVKSLYPTSRCIRLIPELPMGAKKWYISTPYATFWITQGNTAQEAWKTVADLIKIDMLRKLEK